MRILISHNFNYKKKEKERKERFCLTIFTFFSFISSWNNNEVEIYCIQFRATLSWTAKETVICFPVFNPRLWEVRKKFITIGRSRLRAEEEKAEEGGDKVARVDYQSSINQGKQKWLVEATRGGIKVGNVQREASSARCSMRQGDEDEEVIAADRSAVRYGGRPGALPDDKGHEAPG